MSQQMKVNISIPNWNSLDNNTRSLINFFMKDAALYITPEITETWNNGIEQSYDYSKIYCSVQSCTRCYHYRAGYSYSTPELFTIT